MPNHFHGIIIINGRENPAPTLGQIIAFYKYETTKKYNISVGAGFSRPSNLRPQINKLWQRNYFEHVVRDGDDLQRIREYIVNNPAN